MKQIVVEGLISAGKSYFAKEISRIYNFDLYEEPVDDNPYLKLYYQDPKRYALDMQLWLLARRYRMHKEAIKLDVDYVMDRSIYGDFVFARVNHDLGNISDSGFKCYIEHREYMLKDLKYPDYVIFLDAKPDVCLDRILNLRKRDCESGITIEYLEALYRYHFDLMKEFKHRGSQIIHLDWNEFENIESLDLF